MTISFILEAQDTFFPVGIQPSRIEARPPPRRLSTKVTGREGRPMLIAWAPFENNVTATLTNTEPSSISVAGPAATWSGTSSTRAPG